MNIDETLTAKGFTDAWNVEAVFGVPRRIESITIHHWGALGQTHDGVVNFFVNGPGTTSAHFVASDGRVNCLVSPMDAAWHAGNAYGNATSIGIECRPEATDGDYRTVAELVSYLRETYGENLPLIPHRDWQATACPGVWDLTKIDRLSKLQTEMEGPDLDATQATQLKETRDRVIGRDVQRYYNPSTNAVSLTPTPGFVPARSTDLHDVLALNLRIDSLEKKLDAVLSRVV